MHRVWFITGASSGFGRALAEAVLTRGDSAVVSARRKDALDRLAIAHAQSALAIGLDVTDAEARLKAVEAALARFGRIDVLANIAGRGSLGAVEKRPRAARRSNGGQFFRCRRDDPSRAAGHAGARKRSHPPAHQHRRSGVDRRVRSLLRLEVRPRRLERGAAATRSSPTAFGSRSSSRARSAPSSPAPRTCGRRAVSTPIAR